jgi:hypothetical protein
MKSRSLMLLVLMIASCGRRVGAGTVEDKTTYQARHTPYTESLRWVFPSGDKLEPSMQMPARLFALTLAGSRVLSCSCKGVAWRTAAECSSSEH